jgi:mono/diheme cytochrome c family protein
MEESAMRPTALSLLLLFAPAVAGGQPAKDPKTERTWKAKCASCHGEDGKADTEQARKVGGIADMTSTAWQKKFTDEQIKAAIANGLSETRDGRKKEMDAYKSKLPPAQIDALAAWVRALAR